MGTTVLPAGKSCSTAHEEDDLASPAYFCKNCKKDEKRAPSCSGVKKTLLNFHSYKQNLIS